MDNFDLKKFLVENKLTTNSNGGMNEAPANEVAELNKKGLADRDKIAHFVWGREEFMDKSENEIEDLIDKVEEEYNASKGNYSNVEDYIEELEQNDGLDFFREGTYPEELDEADIVSTGEEIIEYEVEVLGEDGKVKSYTKLRADKFDQYIKNRPLPVTIKFNNRTVRAGTKITKVTDDMGRPMNL